MYNESIKSEFLQSLLNNVDETSLRHYKASLTMCEHIEKMLGKDVSDFSYNELLYLFEENRWTTFATFSSTKSKLMTYIKWRLDGMLPLDAPICRLRREDVSGKINFTSDYARDLADVKQYVRDVMQHSDAHEIWKDCTMIIYCLLFYGFDINELGWLRISDVNFIDGSITVITNNTTYTARVDDEILQLIRKISNVEDIEVVKGDTIVHVPLRNDGHILRSIDRNTPNYSRRARVILRYISDVKKNVMATMNEEQLLAYPNLKRNLTPKTVYRSGVFYRALSSGDDITYRYFLDAERTASNYLQGKKYTDDYEMWKSVFY